MNPAQAKPRLLFLAADLSPCGGGSCVTAWTLQALKEHWAVTILCVVLPDFDGVNRHFGTCLCAEDFNFSRLPFPLRHADKFDRDPFSFQRHAWLMRFCRRKARKFEVVVSCEDEIDFGRPGVQYTHYPHLKRHLETLHAAENMSPGQKIKGFFAGTYRPWMLVSGISLAGIRSNLMVTNSHWTAQVLRDTYDVEPKVNYPPVRWTGDSRDWQKRRNSFAVLGRLSPIKRQLEIIDMLERVRSRGFEVDLEIIGDEDVVAGGQYIQKIRDRLEQTSGWARLHQSVSRSKLEELVSGCRFGIHAMLDEHFGIAVAELMRGGCIVFVNDSGGQVEIVGDQPGLRYRSDDDAVEKICRLLENESEQARLRQALRERSSLFSESAFMLGMQEIVSEFAASDLNRGPK